MTPRTRKALAAMAEVLLALAAEHAPEQPPDELVPVRGCGLPERTVRRLLRGELVKLGRAHYVRRSDLLALRDAPRPAPHEDNESAAAVRAAWRASKRRVAA